MTTMLQTLNETATSYTSETRATDSIGGCQYFINDRCCAVGRCLEDPKRFSNLASGVDGFDAHYGLESHLKTEYHGYPLGFWSALQYLHDNRNYWDENGLSEVGKKEVDRIKEEFNL